MNVVIQRYIGVKLCMSIDWPEIEIQNFIVLNEIKIVQLCCSEIEILKLWYLVIIDLKLWFWCAWLDGIEIVKLCCYPVITLKLRFWNWDIQLLPWNWDFKIVISSDWSEAVILMRVIGCNWDFEIVISIDNSEIEILKLCCYPVIGLKADPETKVNINLQPFRMDFFSGLWNSKNLSWGENIQQVCLLYLTADFWITTNAGFLFFYTIFYLFIDIYLFCSRRVSLACKLPEPHIYLSISI